VLFEGRCDVGEPDAGHRLEQLGEAAELAQVHRGIDQEDAHVHLAPGWGSLTPRSAST
jgi:hypothetical protein